MLLKGLNNAVKGLMAWVTSPERGSFTSDMLTSVDKKEKFRRYRSRRDGRANRKIATDFRSYSVRRSPARVENPCHRQRVCRTSVENAATSYPMGRNCG